MADARAYHTGPIPGSCTWASRRVLPATTPPGSFSKRPSAFQNFGRSSRERRSNWFALRCTSDVVPSAPPPYCNRRVRSWQRARCVPLRDLARRFQGSAAGFLALPTRHRYSSAPSILPLRQLNPGLLLMMEGRRDPYRSVPGLRLRTAWTLSSYPRAPCLKHLARRLCTLA